MILSKNSLKFIEALENDPEKLKKLKSLSNDEEVYDYIISIIPDYTKEDFENLKDALYNLEKRQKLSEGEESQIVGGSVLDSAEELCDAFTDGQKSVENVANVLNTASNVIENLASKLKKLFEKLKKEDEKK